jgi:hypothetical protein
MVVFNTENTHGKYTQITKEDFYSLFIGGFEGKPEKEYTHLFDPLEYNFSNIYCLPKTKLDGIHMNRICDVAFATQNPKDSYIFWNTVRSNNITVIINFHELFTYCPDNCEIVEEWNNKITVYCAKDDTYSSSTYIIHARCWADFGVPTVEDCLMTFKLFFKYFTSGKFVVHCRAGIGRTGIFLAIYYAIFGTQDQLQSMLKDFPELNFTSWQSMALVDIVNLLRTRRLHLVQTYEQFTFCERFITEQREELLSYVPKSAEPEPTKPEQVVPTPVEPEIVETEVPIETLQIVNAPVQSVQKVVIHFKLHFSDSKCLRNKSVKTKLKQKYRYARHNKHCY